MKLPTGSKRLIRDMNTLVLLDLIQRQGAMSRIEVARRSGLAPSTVTSLAKRLIQAGVITEEEDVGDAPPRPRRRGRRPLRLRFNPDAFHCLAVDLDRTRSTISLLNLEPRVISHTNFPVPDVGSEIVPALLEALRQFMDREAVDREKLLGIAIGVPGIVGQDGETVRSPVTLQWTDAVSLKRDVSTGLGLTVYLENDTNAAALAEQLYGAAQGVEHLVYVTMGEGVGAGIVMHGSLLRGVAGAGEFGHTTVEADGELCRCGNRGCIENQVSMPALLRRFQTLTGRSDASAALMWQVLGTPDHPEHPAALSLVQEAGRILGAALVNVTNLLDPELIVLGGMAPSLGDAFLEAARQMLSDRIGILTFDPNQVVFSRFGPEAETTGLAALLIQRAFSPEGSLSHLLDEGAS